MNALPDYAQALIDALSSVALLPSTEVVTLDHALHRVLAQDIVADRDLPPFNRAQMDGYAVRVADLVSSRSLPVASALSAGASMLGQTPAGHCVRIATGAPVPNDLDAVIEHERTDRGDLKNARVIFNVENPLAGRAIHPCGSDAQRGQVIVPSGTLLQAPQLGLAATVGYDTLTVRARPRVTILTSGDEVVPHGSVTTSLQPQQIRNSNGPMLLASLKCFGAGDCTSIHLPDDLGKTVSALRHALERSDLVVTVGGISAGERDFFPAAYSECGIALSLRGAAIQPGKPIAVGRNNEGRVLVGLPGNPVSVLACAHLFLWPVVRHMMGIASPLPWRLVNVAEAVKANQHRRAFRPATLLDQQNVAIPRWSGSGDLVHTAATDGLLELPIQDGEVPSGTPLRFLAWA